MRFFGLIAVSTLIFFCSPNQAWSYSGPKPSKSKDLLVPAIGCDIHKALDKIRSLPHSEIIGTGPLSDDILPWWVVGSIWVNLEYEIFADFQVPAPNTSNEIPSKVIVTL